MVSGKPKEVSISTTMVLIIIADISRALTMCQALSSESHTLTRLILAKTLGGWLLLSSLFAGHRDTKKLVSGHSPATVQCPREEG